MDLTGKEAILFKGQGLGIGNWVAFVDEIFEGFASPLDLVEYLVKVRVPRPALEGTPSGRTLGVFSPTRA